ncbi:hypothetical protein CEXT_574391 [Caerostris extrusa]|uniref:Uncharacterized protein n=1 Tax=Caerostris extrusa TaxID=172846 RepID=A0AAV4XZW5_CAEEX|nr:hypothetical protein CEXT_574391 [Caerostris extrusa]
MMAMHTSSWPGPKLSRYAAGVVMAAATPRHVKRDNFSSRPLKGEKRNLRGCLPGLEQFNHHDSRAPR